MTIEDQQLNGAHADAAGAEFMSVREAAEKLGFVPAKVYRMDRDDGPFRITKVGRRVLVDRRDFERYLSQRATPTMVLDPSAPSATNSKAGQAEIVPASRESCGQREFILPAPRYYVAMFMSW
jgi:excisionase family DNA binding protein